MANNLIRCSDMLDSMPFDVYAVDLQTDKLVYANKNLMNRHIIEKDMPCYKAINGRDSKCLFCRRDELLDKNGAPNGNMLTYEHFNEADDRWYQMQERAIVWDDGKIVKYVIAVDISELKSVQNSLAEAHAALAIKNKELELAHIQMAKQAQLGELLDMIAHQWKQPISAISILFDELKLLQTLKQIDDESILKICSEGRKTIGTINKTLNEFRSFFDPSNEKTTFDTVVAIKNTMELISKKLSYDNITIELQTNTDNTNAYGIASEFSQVVLAIVTNGAEAIVSKRARDLLEKKRLHWRRTNRSKKQRRRSQHSIPRQWSRYQRRFINENI